MTYPLGTQVADRYDEKFNDVVGFMVSTLILRTKITYETKITDLIKSVMSSVHEAIDNKHITYDRLVQICGIQN